jgi:spore maturation protein CgeB
MRFVFLGLSITSSRSHVHATTYRGLVRELSRRGHEVLFLERDVASTADHRDLPAPPGGTTRLYASLEELRERWTPVVRRADVVLVGSGVPDGALVARWALEEGRGVVAFYDLETPMTLARLARGEADDLSAELIPGFDLYLSITGGPVLDELEREWGAHCARALHCSVDPDVHGPDPAGPGQAAWELGYLDPDGLDRQPRVERLLCETARRRPGERFVIAGAQQLDAAPDWPANVDRIAHLAPPERRAFYNAQRFTLDVAHDDQTRADHSPSVRLLEAAACGTPIISERRDGLESFFVPGEELLLADGPDDVLRALSETSEAERLRRGARARARVLAAHTAAHRAAQLERYCGEV